jgi:hypothetical protein
MLHKELVARAVAWLNKRCGVVLQEYNCRGLETPDALGFKKDYTILIECKMSRPDFRRDGKKDGRSHGANHYGNRRFYLVPEGLIRPDEVPDGWGLLYAGSESITVVVRAPFHKELEIKVEENKILYSLARRAVIRGYLPSLCETINGAYV